MPIPNRLNVSPQRIPQALPAKIKKGVIGKPNTGRIIIAKKT